MQTVFTTNLPKLLAQHPTKLTQDVARSLAILQPGQTVMLGPLPELVLRGSCTIALAFYPIWEPWTEADASIKPPCLLQFGSAATPGTALRISVNRELDGLRLERPGTPAGITLATQNLKDGGILFVTLDRGTATISFISKVSGEDQNSDAFTIGNIGSQPGVMQVGTDSAGGKESPFAGLAGPVLVFDGALARADMVKSKLLDRLLTWDPLAGLLTADESRPIASALVGIGWLGEKRFEVNRRDIVWPDPKQPDRWILENAAQPEQLDVMNADKADHSLYSADCLWCFVRRGRAPVLHGDAGQRFRLEYQGSAGGKTSFTGVSLGRNAVGADDHVSTLTLTVEDDTIEITPNGWTNASGQFFPLMLGAPGADIARDASELWPEEIRLIRVAPTYDMLVDPQHRNVVSQSQTYKDAFSQRVPSIGASSLGWDVTRLNNSLNPLVSDGAKRTAQYWMLQSPADDSRSYRLENDIATPYYCFTELLHDAFGSKMSTMYSSAREFSEKQSISFGASASMGKEKLFDSSITLSKSNTAASSEEHTIVVARHTKRHNAVVLDRRWMMLTDAFVKAVLRLAANPTQAECNSHFLTYGTHYANAITYGSRAYSLGIIDAKTMSTVVEDGVDMKASVGIPIEGVTIGATGGRQTSTSTKADAALNSSIDFDQQVGSEKSPMPLLLDLRPAIELMQPPYICSEILENSLPTIAAHLDTYLEQRRSATKPGYRLVQARLVSIENPTAQTVTLMARAFLAAVDAQADWDIVLPPSADRDEADFRMWASSADTHTPEYKAGDDSGLIRIAPSSTYTPAKHWTFAYLPIPRSRTDLVPAIGWTGQATMFDDAHYHRLLDQNPQLAAAAGTVAVVGLGVLGLLGLGAAKALNAAGVTHIATDDEILAAENKQAGIDGFPFLGMDWAQDYPALYGDFGAEFTFQEKRKLHIAPSPTFTSVVINAGQVNAKFDVRIIDPAAFFEKSSAFPKM